MRNAGTPRAVMGLTPHLFALLLASGVLMHAVVGCSNVASKGKRKASPTAEEAAARKVLESLAAEFGATTSWLEFSKGTNWGEHVFMIQARPALMPSDGRPIVIIGEITDVEETNPKAYEVRMTAGHLDLFLQANEEMIKTIMQSPHGTFDTFVAIVRPSSIKKRLFSVKGEPLYDDEIPSADLSIEASNGFVASGMCLAIRPLGEGGLGLALEYSFFR